MNLAIPGPIGGVDVCVDTSCVPVPGIANVHIVVSLDSANSTLLALVSFGLQPGRTANVDLAVSITTPGISAVLDGYFSFTITDPQPQPDRLPVHPARGAAHRHPVADPHRVDLRGARHAVSGALRRSADRRVSNTARYRVPSSWSRMVATGSLTHVKIGTSRSV